MLVLNATPLIYLSKVERLELLSELDEELVIPTSVHREVVVAGQERGESDARRVAKLLEEGTIDLVEAPSRSLAAGFEESENLHEAERDVLLLADEHEATAILDERYGRGIARSEGIDHGGTLFVLLELVMAGAMTPDGMRETVDAMIEAGWYCSTKLYAEILRTIEELE